MTASTSRHDEALCIGPDICRGECLERAAPAAKAGCTHKPTEAVFIHANGKRSVESLCFKCDEVAPGAFIQCPNCSGSGRAETAPATWGKCPGCKGRRVVYRVARRTPAAASDTP